MDDKYLWDRSGEPDADIQQLEDLLGTLRYQPQPLKIPADFQIARRRSFYPPLAIAASLLFFAIAIGMWVGFNRPSTTVANNPQPQPEPAVVPTTTNKPGPPPERRVENAPVTPIQLTRAPRPSLAGNKTRTRRSQPPALTPEELALKQQVLVALRLTSAKLNVAQRSVQGTPPQSTIRNQHKIG